MKFHGNRVKVIIYNDESPHVGSTIADHEWPSSRLGPGRDACKDAGTLAGQDKGYTDGSCVSVDEDSALCPGE